METEYNVIMINMGQRILILINKMLLIKMIEFEVLPLFRLNVQNNILIYNSRLFMDLISDKRLLPYNVQYRSGDFIKSNLVDQFQTDQNVVSK